MKTTNGEIYATKDSIQKLIDADVPIKAGLKILKMAKALASEIAIIEQARNMLIKKYGTEIGEGKNKTMGIKPTDENFPKFVEEMTELMAAEADVPDKVQVPDTLTMEVKDLATLEPFIEVA